MALKPAEVSLGEVEVQRADGAAVRFVDLADRPTVLVIAFPLLVDPARNVHEALTLPRKWWVAMNPIGWWNYLRAIFRGNRQGRIVDPLQIPGLALLDASATVRRIHRGRSLGDYPPPEVVLTELGPLTTRRTR